jgi:hypothetical protein
VTRERRLLDDNVTKLREELQASKRSVASQQVRVSDLHDSLTRTRDRRSLVVTWMQRIGFRGAGRRAGVRDHCAQSHALKYGPIAGDGLSRCDCFPCCAVGRIAARIHSSAAGVQLQWRWR